MFSREIGREIMSIRSMPKRSYGIAVTLAQFWA